MIMINMRHVCFQCIEQLGVGALHDEQTRSIMALLDKLISTHFEKAAERDGKFKEM